MKRCKPLIACSLGWLLGALGGLGGCKTTDIAPSPGVGDPYIAPYNDPQISVLSPELRRWIVFQPAIVSRREHRPMAVEVPVRNVTDTQLLIEYRFSFYDSHDRQLRPEIGWTTQALDPKQVARLRANAMDDQAKNYRLEVRWSR